MDESKDGIVRAGRVGYRGRVCQSDRSWLGRTISWLSFRFAFRNESRMYSSLYSRLGNSRFRGMHGDAVYPLWYTCTWNPMWVAYVSVHTYEASLLGRSLLIAHTWYAYDSASESRVKAGFQGCDIVIFPGHRYYFLILGFTSNTVCRT